MISLIICSIDQQHLTRFRDNISATIGVAYEVLVWDNRATNTGLCEVYNRLAECTNYDLLIFLHEDLIITTQNWGKNLVEHFRQDPQVGLIGVAGSRFKSTAYSGWYTGIPEFDCVNIIHRYTDRDESQFLNPAGTKNKQETVCLDGVFIACKKEIWSSLRFDADNLKGFHFYDIDFSLRAAQLTKLIVVYDIDIIHITKGGDFGEKWVSEAIRFHTRSKGQLPVTKLHPDSSDKTTKITKTWLDVLKNYDISWKSKIRWIKLQGLAFKPRLAYALTKFLFYKKFGLARIHKRFRQ